MAKIIAIVNQKGGVGKTTTCVNLAACLTQEGAKVLVCDFDPQGNATSGAGVDMRTCETTIYDLVLEDEPDVATAIVHGEHLDVLSASMALSGAEIELIAMEKREFRLKNVLENVKDDYDYIFVDCPPSLGILTLNCLCAADSFLVPLQTEYYALEGLSQLTATVRSVQRVLNRNLRMEGILLTMYDGRTNLALQVVEEVKKHFGERVYGTYIPRNVRLSEAPSHGIPITAYDRNCRGGRAYSALADEFLNRDGRV